MTNPRFIQSKATGVVYTYSYTLNSGLYAYASPDGFLMIPTAEELANDFNDVTELETRLRAELAHEAHRDGDSTMTPTDCPHTPRCPWKLLCAAKDGYDVKCEWFVMCERPAKVYRIHATLGPVPVCPEHSLF